MLVDSCNDAFAAAALLAANANPSASHFIAVPGSAPWRAEYASSAATAASPPKKSATGSAVSG